MFFLLQNQRTGGRGRVEQVVPRAGIGVALMGKGDDGERGRRMNMVQIMIHMYVNAKMIPVETVPGIGGGGMKESSGRSEFR
jgi:hypothetical protein